MIQREAHGRRLLVLDTNVLMHDPTAIFRFQEHDLYLPMVVLEELDAGKKGISEVARNARQASRLLDGLIRDVDQNAIRAGVPLAGATNQEIGPGRLFFQTQELKLPLPNALPGNKPDNEILGTALALQETQSERRVTLVSKDINLRIKAAVLGVHAEDYYHDRALEDADLLYTGVQELVSDFWESCTPTLEAWQEGDRSYYRVHGEITRAWYPKQFILVTGPNEFQARVRGLEADTAVLESTHNFGSPEHSVWGIAARNREQNFALNLLLDPTLDFVSLQGTAGTGKTLLALAAGLFQTLERGIYREIIMTRVTVPVGEDIGFLPGNEEEKMTPWMGALMDNLEVLNQVDDNRQSGEHATGSSGSAWGDSWGADWGRAAANDLVQRRIKIHSLNFMRGRTFLNRYIILDEAQNLTAKQLKTLITRAGPGTKVVCLGNLAQIDTPYLAETTSGLTYVVDHFKHWQHSGHITLQRGERSRLADYASGNL